MVDLIRSGKAPDLIRRKGAEGNLPVPVPEKIEILTLLADAPESNVCEKALETLQAWDRKELRAVMASPQTAPGALRFAAEKLLAGWEGLRDVLLWNPSLPAESRELLRSRPAADTSVVDTVAATPGPSPMAPVPEPAMAEIGKEPTDEPEPSPEPISEEMAVELLARLAAGAQIEEVMGVPVEAPPEATKHDDELTQKDRETLIEKIRRMSVVQKIKAALAGNLETRALLIRDSNKVVARAVLQSPKISETEAESYASAKNVSEEVLRLIAMNRKFIKSYVVMRALVHNPHAPIKVTVPLVGRMNDRDLKGLSLNRNVPEAVRSMAIRAIRRKVEAGRAKQTGRH